MDYFYLSDSASHDAKFTSHDLRSYVLGSHLANLNMPKSNLDFLVNCLPSYIRVCSPLKRSTFGNNVMILALSGDHRWKNIVILSTFRGSGKTQ